MTVDLGISIIGCWSSIVLLKHISSFSCFTIYLVSVITILITFYSLNLDLNTLLILITVTVFTFVLVLVPINN